MKHFLLSFLFIFSAIATNAQCPGPDISIDNFSGGSCDLSISSADPLNTIKQAECTGRVGAISGAADIWIQKNVAAGGATTASLGYYGVDNFDFASGSFNISTFSITYDGEDGDTDPDNPTLSGPILGDFTNRTIQFLASLDVIGVGKSVTFTASVWDAAGNRSEAILTLNGGRSSTTSEILNLGLFSGTADLTDIRAIQFKMATTQNGFDLTLDQLSAVCSGFLLPVKLTGFSAKYTNGITDLNWNTVSEINFDHFEIESSTDGASFIRTGTVAAKENMGSIKNYHFQYNAVLTTTTRFRLKAIDTDGKYFFSSIITVNPVSQAQNNFTVSPTLFTSSVTLKIQSAGVDAALFRIMDINGGVWYSKTLKLNKGFNTINIDDLDGLTKGIYIAQVISSGKIEYKKIVRQ